MIQKVYELTTNEKDGFAKWYVRGIKDDNEARKIALKGFGKRYYSKSLIGYYDDYPSKHGSDWSKFTKKEFIRKTKRAYRTKKRKL